MIYQIQYQRGDDKPEFIAQNEFPEGMYGFVEELCMWIKDVTKRIPNGNSAVVVLPQTHPAFAMSKAVNTGFSPTHDWNIRVNRLPHADIFDADGNMLGDCSSVNVNTGEVHERDVDFDAFVYRKAKAPLKVVFRK